MIGKALNASPGEPDALALLAVIAVAQNEREKALDLAKKAVSSAPQSANALVALSYAQQANFDLEGALSSLEEAVKVAPRITSYNVCYTKLLRKTSQDSLVPI